MRPKVRMATKERLYKVTLEGGTFVHIFNDMRPQELAKRMIEIPEGYLHDSHTVVPISRILSAQDVTDQMTTEEA